MMSVLTLIFTACAGTDKSNQADKQASENKDAKKVLVAYFSATGTTAKAAERVAKAAGADLFEIQAEPRFTEADLDWRNPQSRCSIDMQNYTSRPAIKENVTDIDKYDVVFIGFPIWGDLAPRHINTFIENNKLDGKVVIPFATSGSSPIANSENDLRKLYPSIKWQSGKLLNEVSDKELQEWVDASCK